MKLNELVCPTCGLKCMTDASYTTCASCQTFFYANQSRSVNTLTPMITIVWPPVFFKDPSTTTSQPLRWVEVTTTPPHAIDTASTGVLTSDVEYQVWN